MSDEWWPDNPAEVDSFGLYSYYEMRYARKIIREWKDSNDAFHQYEVMRAKKILENPGFDVDDQYSPVVRKEKIKKILND